MAYWEMHGYYLSEEYEDISQNLISPDVSFFLNIPVEIYFEKQNQFDKRTIKAFHDLYIKYAVENKGIIISLLLPERAIQARIIYETKHILNL